MGHKTLIGGTAYEITGGKTLVDGTAYSIASGKNLVDGTAYEVGFGKKATITLPYTIDTSSTMTYIEYNGTKYYPSLTSITFEANIGDTIICHAYSFTYVNGVEASSYYADYSYTVVGNAAIMFAGSGSTLNYINIVETDVSDLILFRCRDNSTSAKYAYIYHAVAGMTWNEWCNSAYDYGDKFECYTGSSSWAVYWSETSTELDVAYNDIITSTTYEFSD